MFFGRAVRILTGAAMLSTASPSLAAFISSAAADSRVELTFTGKVEYSIDNNVRVKNPDNSFTTFDRSQIPAYRFNNGDELSLTFSFDQNAPAFSNAGCGGRFQLRDSGSPGGATGCQLETRISTPFGRPQFGGAGGDSPPFIAGFDILKDPQTGELSIDFPTGSYQVNYLGVNPYYFDSATKTLTGPDQNICVDSRNCPQAFGTGTSSAISFLIPIAGDFGLVSPGLNIGYDAGSIGSLNLVGGFSFSGNGGTPVPAPGGLILFALAAAGLVAGRKRKVLQKYSKD